MKSIKYLLFTGVVYAFNLYGAVEWKNSSAIPAGVKDNIGRIIKAANLGDFNIIAGTMDAPAIKAMFAKKFPGKILKHDGFFVCIDGKNIIVGSRTAAGVCHGVNHAAEKLSNYAAPRSMTQDEILPGKAKTDLKYRICTNPVFPIRSLGVCSYNGYEGNFARWMIRNGYNTAWGGLRFSPDYYPLSQNDGFYWRTGGHGFYYWINGKDYKAHPEYFPLIKGKRARIKGDYAVGVQLNVGNKELHDLVARRVIEYVKKYPAAQLVAMGMNDGGGWGDSPEERAMDDPEEYKHGIYSTRYIRFVNIIAEKVAKLNPDIRICALPYLSCVKPPDPKNVPAIHPNVELVICTYRRCYKCRIDDENCSVNRYWKQVIDGWRKLSKNITIYDYLLMSGAHFPLPVLRVIQQDLQYFKKCGFVGYHTEIIPDGGKHELLSRGRGFYRSKPEYHENYWTGAKSVYYILSKLLWDPYQNIDKLYADYFNNYYGAGGKDLYKIFQLIDRRWQEDEAPFVWSSGAKNLPRMIFRKGDAAFIEKQLKAAEKAAAGEPVFAKRVKRASALVRGLWYRQLGAQTKVLRVKDKGVFDGYFVRRRGGGELSKYRSRVEVAIKGDKMIIKGEFFQPESSTAVANPGRDGAGYYGDTFEIFIGAGPKMRKDGYYQFIISAGGGMYDGQLRNKTWNSSFTARTEVKNDRWTAWVTIPLKELGYERIRKGDRIQVNFASVRSKLKEISSWTNGDIEGMDALGTLIVE